MKHPSHGTVHQNGSSLVIVFWLIGLLGLSMIVAMRFAATDTQWTAGLLSAAHARNLAESGLAIASHPSIRRLDPALSWVNETADQSYQAAIRCEEALLPLNQLLLLGRKDVVRRLILRWGMPSREADSLIDAMVDWVDADDLLSPNGAESRAYQAAGKPGFPLNRPFASLDELEEVMGMKKLVALKPDWRDYFTLWSTGQIDLNEATEEMILAAAGSGDSARVSQFVALRAGPDRIPGSADDHRFTSVAEAFKLLALEPGDHLAWFTVEGPTARIESVGIFRNRKVRISETRRDQRVLARSEKYY